VRALTFIIGTLLNCLNFSVEDYEALITKIAQVLFYHLLILLYILIYIYILKFLFIRFHISSIQINYLKSRINVE
jgi:hypothetical protein